MPQCLITVVLCVLVTFVAGTAGASEHGDRVALPVDRLPAGPVQVGDLTVEATAPVMIRSDAAEPVRLAHWPDGRLATSVSVLHTFEPGRGIANWRAATGLAHRQAAQLPDWPTVLNYQITYADGQTVLVPVRFGEAIREWYRVHTVGPMLWARHAWTVDLDPTAGERLAAYAMTIPNPRPAIPVTALAALAVNDPWNDYGRAAVLGVAISDAPLQGRLLFVDRKPVGDDSQPGTFDQPFGTLQHALKVANPGDTILVRGGRYALDQPIFREYRGTAGQWLTISAFPGETPVFDGWGIHYDAQGNTGRRELGRGEFDTGVIHLWGDPDSLRIQGLHIVRSMCAGISVYGERLPQEGATGSQWGTTDHVEILFNDIYQTYSMAIISHQTNHLVIVGNQIVRPHSNEMAVDPATGDQRTLLHGFQEAIDISRNRDFEIAFNTVAGGGKEAIDCISVEDGSIHHNYVHSCLNGIYIDSWSVPIRRLDIHHNFIHNAYNGIPLATEGSNDLMDFDIRNNIVLDSKSEGIAIREATYKAKPAKVQQHRVHNNTVHHSGHHAVAIGWQTGGIGVGGFPDNLGFRDITIRDNIVTQSAGRPMANAYAPATDQHGISFTHNLVWPTTDDLTPPWMRREDKRWHAEHLERGRNTIVADPVYRNPQRGDFRPAEGSPAIAAASDGGDIGAVRHDAAWVPGLDFAGVVTAYYYPDTLWKPVRIAPDKFTIHRNHLQRPSWFQESRYGADFRTLPDGEQAFGGITWWIEPDSRNSNPNVLALSGIQSESTADSITGIAVGRSAAKLAFLHNAHLADSNNTPKGLLIAHYRVHYADGSHVDIPVRFGLEVGHWTDRQTVNRVDHAQVAWTMQYTHTRRREGYLHLYAMEWDNPRPDREITSISIRRAAEPLQATLAVFAISTGDQ